MGHQKITAGGLHPSVNGLLRASVCRCVSGVVQPADRFFFQFSAAGYNVAEFVGGVLVG